MTETHRTEVRNGIVGGLLGNKQKRNYALNFGCNAIQQIASETFNPLESKSQTISEKTNPYFGGYSENLMKGVWGRIKSFHSIV